MADFSSLPVQVHEDLLEEHIFVKKALENAHIPNRNRGATFRRCESETLSSIIASTEQHNKFELIAYLLDVKGFATFPPAGVKTTLTLCPPAHMLFERRHEFVDNMGEVRVFAQSLAWPRGAHLFPPLVHPSHSHPSTPSSSPGAPPPLDAQAPEKSSGSHAAVAAHLRQGGRARRPGSPMG